MDPSIQYIAVAVISAVTIILFKKIQGLLGRKYVNPVAAAKLLVLAPIYSTALIPQDHLLAAKISSFTALQNALGMCYSYNALNRGDETYASYSGKWKTGSPGR